MARGTKVSVGIEVDVTGADDIDALARSTEAAAKAAGKPIAVDAKVSGGDAVADLAADLDAVPTSTSTTLAAKVTGAASVTDLADDLKAVPTSTSTTLTASVTGELSISDLADDLDAVPASTSTTLAASVTGELSISDLADDIAAMPASTAVSVTATVKGGESVGDLKTNLGDVDTAAGDASDGVGAASSEIAGTLGGQFSDGIGLVADFGEQLGGLKQQFSDAGGGFTAFAKIATGVGTTIVAGFIVDTISGEIETANRLMAESETVVGGLTQTLIDNGNQWDINAQKQLISTLQGTETFNTLREAGASTKDLLDAFFKGDTTAYGKVWEAVGAGEKAFDADTISALKAGQAMIDSGGQAQTAAQYILDYEDANGLSEDAADANADAADNSADSMKGAGKAAQAAGTDIYELDRQKLRDKGMKLTADDKATPAVDKANKHKLNDKKNTLKSTDKATPAVTSYNGKPLKDKDSDLDANDYASSRVDTFNSKAINDKTADIYGNTDPLKDDIAAVDGTDISVDVTANPIGTLWDALFSGVSVGGSSAGGEGLSASSAPVLGLRVPAGAHVTAPIVVNVSGALDPAAVARQIRQVLTRADRRVGAVRTGGAAGVPRAPV